MKVEYSSNNSGGGWWLTDKHWQKLEKAGWEVEWGGKWFCHSRFKSLVGRPAYPFVECPEPDGGKRDIFGNAWNACPGHRIARSYEEMKSLGDKAKANWLGALATTASKEFPDLASAIREWEKVTGLTASEVGCGCCGPPHTFSSRGADDQFHYASGDDIVDVLYPNAPKSRRAAAEAAE